MPASVVDLVLLVMMLLCFAVISPWKCAPMCTHTHTNSQRGIKEHTIITTANTESCVRTENRETRIAVLIKRKSADIPVELLGNLNNAIVRSLERCVETATSEATNRTAQKSRGVLSSRVRSICSVLFNIVRVNRSR